MEPLGLYIIAKCLQITGFLLTTIFGAILLEEKTIGRFAQLLKTKAFGFSKGLYKILRKTYNPVEFIFELVKHPINPLSPLSPLSPLMVYLAFTLYYVAGIVFIISGWLCGISWLFWVGIVITSPYIITWVTINLVRVLRFGLKGLLSYPLVLFLSFWTSFVIWPVILTIYILVLYILLISTVLTYLVTSGDNIKKISIIFGGSLVLIGLIMELIAAL